MIQTLAAQIKQYKKDSIITPILSIFEGILETLIPFVMAAIIDEGISVGNMGAILKYGAIIVLLACCSLFCGVTAGRFSARASTGFACNLREAMFANIQNFSFANIDKYSTAGLVTRLTTDVTNLQNAFQMLMRMCMRAPVSMICALVLAFAISPKLSMIFVVAILFLLVVLAVIIGPAAGIFEKVFQKYDALNASVQENITGIRVVKSFVREAHENKKYTAAANNVYKLFVGAEKRLIYNMPAMMLCIYGCNLALSWMGAKMIVGGSLTTGQLTSLFSYIMNILMGLMMLSMVFVMITMSAASARRIAEVLNEKSDLADPEKPLTTVPDGSIDFEHVSFTYQRQGSGRPVLQDVNLHVRPGEVIGVIGGTGSAKSSFVQLVPRLYDATEGVVKVGGIDVRAYEMKALRDQVSMVLQKNVLFSGTIYDNLRWGNENATDEECRRACRLACADEFIDRLPEGYNTYIEQGGTNVSGGQKQRLCIARALLKKPKILILDDSTSAVDTATDAKIRKAFHEEIPDTTMLIIAQRISSVQGADRIVVLDNGRIDGVGTHEELLKTNQIYQEVYNGQTQGGGDFDKQGGAQ
ncbi:MAG: ABC transporter ATP-binding protein/permease [Faecalibacterium sp.]|jgi:ATP-binding cassette subfamily B protein|nr:ABC transporter ATP-binding protein/permease [Faecalibacterium sp.]